MVKMSQFGSWNREAWLLIIKIVKKQDDPTTLFVTFAEIWKQPALLIWGAKVDEE